MCSVIFDTSSHDNYLLAWRRLVITTIRGITNGNKLLGIYRWLQLAGKGKSIPLKTMHFWVLVLRRFTIPNASLLPHVYSKMGSEMSAKLSEIVPES